MKHHIYGNESVVQLPEWMIQLRRSEITNRLRKDHRTTSNNMPLGVSFDVAMGQATNWGQAEFDEPSGGLSPTDRVLLYAYYNQLRHLEELTAAFSMLFGQTPPKENPIVIDVGCGPCTGGLALAGVLGSEQKFDYIGIDPSQTMRSLGEQLASSAEQMDIVKRRWSPDISSLVWDRAPGWREVIVIASYLLASRSLDVETLAPELDMLLQKISFGRTIILYTNSTQREANRNFPVFSKAIQNMNFDLHVDGNGVAKAKRKFGDTKNHKLRYALFVRPKQQIFPLSGD